jgi:hypothetical protein
MFPRLRLGARHLCNDRNTQLVTETKHAQSQAGSAGLFAGQNLTNDLYTSTRIHGVTSQKELSTSPPLSGTFHNETSSRVRHQRAVDAFVTSSLTIYQSITFRHSNAGRNSNKLGFTLATTFIHWPTSKNLVAKLSYNITSCQRCFKDVHHLLVCSWTAYQI